jgi:hypothetical protein
MTQLRTFRLHQACEGDAPAWAQALTEKVNAIRGQVRALQEGEPSDELANELFNEPVPVFEPGWATRHRQLKLEERERWLEDKRAIGDMIDGGLPDLFMEPSPPVVLARKTD